MGWGKGGADFTPNKIELLKVPQLRNYCIPLRVIS